MRGRLYTGTSGFAYPGWAPRFYPAGLRSEGFLRSYAARLTACELSSTYYRQPRATQISAWTSSTPASFRFAVKAQRGGSVRAFTSDDPRPTLDWLIGGLGVFGDRLGCVLFRVPAPFARADDRLERLLTAWPAGVRAAFEFQHLSWQVDEVYDRVRASGGVVVATELEEDVGVPPITVTGPFVYLRLRRLAYSSAELDAWAARIEPFLDGGLDVFAFFRHDEVGTGPEFALGLASRLDPAASRTLRVEPGAPGSASRADS